MKKCGYLLEFTAEFKKELTELSEISAAIFGISVVVWGRVVVSPTKILFDFSYYDLIEEDTNIEKN